MSAPDHSPGWRDDYAALKAYGHSPSRAMAHPRKGLFGDGPKEIAVVDKERLVELAEHWEGQCNRYVNGRCDTRRCLVRGGYVSGPPDFTLATCEEHETAAALRSLSTPSMKDEDDD